MHIALDSVSGLLTNSIGTTFSSILPDYNYKLNYEQDSYQIYGSVFVNQIKILAEYLKLSERRALAVNNLFMKFDISNQFIETMGFGATLPIIFDNDSDEHRKLNRRVEIQIVLN